MVTEEFLRKHFERFFNFSFDILCVIGADGFLKVINAAGEKSLMYSEQELLAKPFIEFVYPEDRVLTQREFESVHQGALMRYFENRIACKDGSLRWFSWNSYSIPSEGLIYSIARDITRYKLMESELRDLSLTDELTGLYNRRGFFALGEKYLKLAPRGRKGLLILSFDLDRMKFIIYTFGHAEGDAALVGTAEVLRMTFRKSDILSRLGGDEFATVAMINGEAEAGILMKRCEETLGIFNRQHKKQYELSLSFGSAFFDSESRLSLSEMLKLADNALYAHKRRHQIAPADAVPL